MWHCVSRLMHVSSLTLMLTVSSTRYVRFCFWQGCATLLQRCADLKTCSTSKTSDMQVSATHVNTMHWHQMWQLPFRALMADRELLNERGYAMEKDMVHVRSLDPAMLTLKNKYAIDSQEVLLLPIAGS